MFDDLAGAFIQTGAETGEGFKFLELGVGELEVAGHCAVGCALRLAADARNGFADIDCGKYSQFEQRRREIDLSVRDRNEVGRDVGGYVLGLRLDDGERGQRAASAFLTQMGGALEHPRMNVEDVSGEGLASGWPAEQEGKLAIGAGVLREVVVNDQHVATRFHEVLRNAGRGIGSDIGKTGCVVALGDDDDGVIHRALLPQNGHDLRHGGSALPYGTIDAEHVFPALVQDGVERNGRLAGPPISQNQLPLAATDGDQRIDDREAGLKRHNDGSAVHDGRGGAFDGQTPSSGDRPSVIERPSERVDHATEQSVPHRHVHDAACALDFIACVQMRILTEQHDTDFVLVHIERDAEGAARKL